MGKAIALARALALLGLLASAGAAVSQEVRLTGVVVSGQASMAIIAGADGREKVYRLGHEVLPGATLAEVSAHGVTLERNRGREWLPLVGGSGAPVRPFAQAPQAPPRPAEPTPGASAAASFSSEPRAKFTAELAKQGTSTPAPGGGFQLNEVAPDGAYAAIGLRPGDVLRSVNGTPVDSSKELNALARQVGSGQPGYVEVVRDGEVSVLRFGQAQ